MAGGLTGPRLRWTLLFVLVSLITAGGVVGGFLAGRHTARDAYVGRVAKLLTAQNTPRTLYEELGHRVDDAPTMQAMAKLYDVRADDRPGLVRRLQGVVWVPAHRPAPFVGHLARPVAGDDVHVNRLGFRDRRESYLAKPAGTVRIFVTGGSLAWGSGASSQTQTITDLLERRLNERASSAAERRYEVINAAYPGWSTTHEKLLIQQRLVDLHPDVIVMLSGGNDVHWALNGRDIRWLYNYTDENSLALLNELYRSSGHPEWAVAAPSAGRPLECPELARLTARNVTEAAAAAGRANAGVIFALQPNVVSSDKQLSAREHVMLERQNRPYWNACYQALRDELGRIGAANYRWLDLSRSFGELDAGTEVFVDRAHVADRGNRLLALALADRIETLPPVVSPGR